MCVQKNTLFGYSQTLPYHTVIVCLTPFIENIFEEMFPSAFRASLYARLERYENLGNEIQLLVRRPVTET